MSEKVTQDLTGGDGRSFEERVMARFDAIDTRFTAIDSSLQDVNTRLEKLEAREYDTKPIWERALKEIAETRRELFKRLDRIEAIALENRSDIRDAEDRIERLEQKPTQ
jgi:hypothetical protein